MRRLAKEKDLEQVYSIYMDESVIPFLGYDSMSLDNFRSIYKNLIENEDFFVYEQDQDIVGFYRASKYPGRASHVAYLGTLAVSPKFQGKGFARSMISEAIQILTDSSVIRVEIIVESDNPRAIGFYESFGFKIEGTLKKFYKRSHQNHYVDDYIMAVLLD
jgi:ribosomal protein S18 acetylase RimI-like enzyme